MPATAPMSEAMRREFIAARQRRSVAWRGIHLLGSLKLALLLLATIALACAVATFCESRFDTKVAQAYIYKAPWFVVWLGVLCVNLFAVTLTRWPWQRKHLGFIITHYGIITLLIGAMIGSHFGFEGNVTLHRGSPPVDRIVTSHSIIQIQNTATGDITGASFDAQLARPTAAKPRDFAVPGTNWKVLADAHSDALAVDQRLAPDPSSEAGPGVVIEFASKMINQRVTLPFALTARKPSSRDFFGLASITFASTLPDRARWRIAESQLVFAKYAPIIQSEAGAATGVTASLSPDGAKLTIILPDGNTSEFDRARITGQPQKIGDTTITAAEYWPDFILAAGKPATASDRPNNPAVLVHVEAPRQGNKPPPHLDLSPAPDGVAYQLGRGDFSISRGTARPGDTFPLGWADWTATLVQTIPHARLESERRPTAPGETGIPGFRARLVGPDGTAGPPTWIATGDTVSLPGGPATVRLGYGLEYRPVPFNITLQNFEVPRLEGTETPANFIATVEFHDPATGVRKSGVAEMNHPASWPGGAFALLTGLNYKFSQAQWNPNDLGETTLQVLYDPGWLFKWTGSLAICVGIFIMFYLRPKKS